MIRLPILTPDGLNEDARALWNMLLETRGDKFVGPDGGLIGPFNSWLYAPKIGERLAGVGSVLRFSSSFEPPLLELAIITVGARWEAEFEWWAHSKNAREAGISDEAIEAIRCGETPTLSDEASRHVYAVANQLVTTGHLDAATYERASKSLGHARLVELVALCGYYSLISFILNTFDVPLPEGVEPSFASNQTDDEG